jgi:hypothetical protein
MLSKEPTHEGNVEKRLTTREEPEQKRARADVIALITTPSGLKVMAAFRIPKSVHSILQHEAESEGVDLTTYVNRLFDGYLHHFGLPSVVRENLDDDRETLGLTRYEHLQYVLFRRHEAVSQQGAAFDRTPKRM